MKLLEKLTPPLEASVVSFLIAVPAFGAKIVVTDSYEIDSAEKIAEVLASDGIDIATGAKVTYSDAAHELVLDKPVTGGGLFSVNGGKHLVLMGDSRDFTGSWEVGGTSTIAVSNRYGLGSSVTTKITILSGAKTKALTFGGDGLTNDVPITSKASVNFRSGKDDTFVQNGLYTHSAAQTVYGGGLVFRGGFSNTSGCTRWQSALNSGTASGFKGAIARLQIFDRVFSNAEMFAYIAGQGGGAAAKVGTQNASSRSMRTARGRAPICASGS